MIQCVANLIGFSCNYIMKEDVDVYCLRISKEMTDDTSDGSHLNKLRSDIVFLMMAISQKYLPIGINDTPDDAILLGPFSSDNKCDAVVVPGLLRVKNFRN